MIAYSDLTLSDSITTVDTTELIFIDETSSIYTADPGKDTKDCNNNADNTINYF